MPLLEEEHCNIPLEALQYLWLAEGATQGGSLGWD